MDPDVRPARIAVSVSRPLSAPGVPESAELISLTNLPDPILTDANQSRDEADQKEQVERESQQLKAERLEAKRIARYDDV